MTRAFLLLCLCLAVSTAIAQENRVALVIGNSAYAHVTPLENPRRDAEAVAKALRETGFGTVQVEQDLGREGMVQALRRFEAEADTADWALVYFAGHGLEFGGANYLVPVDAKLRSDRDVGEETINLDQVLVRLGGVRKLRLVILDACRNNPFLAGMKRTLAVRSTERGLGRVEPDTGTLVAFAAKAGSTASDGTSGQANSPYAAALVENLATPDLEVDFLFRRVRADVLKATGREQDPAVYGSLPPERFVFRSGRVAALPSAAARPAPAPNRTALIGACDRLASSPTDPDRPPGVEGVPPRRMDAKTALPACRAAFEVAPDERRIPFQLGLALETIDAPEEARKAHEKAAAAGHGGAMFRLGYMYRWAKGVGRDLTAARNWYEKAAAAGDAQAMNSLGHMYNTGDGVRRDYGVARVWYEKAVVAGNTSAMISLGLMHERGSAVEKDFDAARDWYEKAALGGDVIGMLYLGIRYESGNGTKKDLVAARHWYESAAALGETTAMTSLGELYEAGKGGEKDLSMARYWYEKAAARGHNDAKLHLAALDRKRR